MVSFTLTNRGSEVIFLGNYKAYWGLSRDVACEEVEVNIEKHPDNNAIGLQYHFVLLCN